MTQFKHSGSKGIPKWQSNRMKQIMVDRWQETWTIVETRNQTRKPDRVVESN